MTHEPYRLFFPLGISCLLWGILLWLPQIWSYSDYPVDLHRILLLNGFMASFIGGFLMTAVPKFSGTSVAKTWETFIYLIVTLLGIFSTYLKIGINPFFISILQSSILLYFIFSRILKRKANPPYSFIFIFLGLFLWLISGLGSQFLDVETFKRLHYEGAMAAIILGVGSRLIPGILGHVEIVAEQRAIYERPVPLLRTVPLHFFVLILIFICSYFLKYPMSEILRALVVAIIAFKNWLLYKLPKSKSALTYSIWISAWLITLSFVLKGIWDEAGIHASHAFFINGLVLLSLLIGTRVIQSHGPQDSFLENWKGLYGISFLIFMAGVTRVSAYLMPEGYLKHLGYSSILLALGVLLWSIKYLRYVFVRPSPN